MAESLDPSTVGLQYLAPSGVQIEGPSDGINSPVAASTGANVQQAQQMISGSNKNTPPGPPIFKWNKYDFLWNAYWGTGGFYDGTVLRKQQTEEDDQYLLRRSMSYYRNFFQQIVDATYKPVFNDGVTRTTEVNGTTDKDGNLAPLWAAFMDDVDNRHHSIGNFCKRAVKNARILEVCFVIMDNVPGVSTELDVESAKAGRLFPYVYMRYPQQVEPEYTQTDNFCKIKQICFKEQPEEVFNAKLNRNVSEKRWKLWTANYSIKLRQNEDTKKLEEIPNTKVFYNLGEVPIIPVMSSETEDGTLLPHPAFYNIARCNWMIYNMDSAECRAICAQMFPILALPMPRGPDASNLQASNPLQGLYLPPAENGVTPAAPMYLEYPTKDFETIAAFMQDLIDDLYRQAGQQGVVATSAQVQSAKSKSYDFHAMHYVLRETAKMAKNLEYEISRIWQLYVKSEKFEYCALYEEDYAPDTDPLEDVNLYTLYLDTQPGPKGRALAHEMMTLSVFDDADEDKVAEVIEEIEEQAVEDAKNKEEIPPEGEVSPDLTPEEVLAAAEAQPNTAPQKKITKLAKRGFTLRKPK